MLVRIYSWIACFGIRQTRPFRKPLSLPLFSISYRALYHSLRHTHATMLAELGASPKYVQHRLGHKNIQVTMNIYQHLTDKMSEEGARLLDTL